VDGVVDARVDTLTVEEPLEIRVAGKSLPVTMRTP
jgi:FdhD protein